MMLECKIHEELFTWCSAETLRGEGLQTGLLNAIWFFRDCAQGWKIKTVGKTVLCSNKNWTTTPFYSRGHGVLIMAAILQGHSIL